MINAMHPVHDRRAKMPFRPLPKTTYHILTSPFRPKLAPAHSMYLWVPLLIRNQFWLENHLAIIQQVIPGRDLILEKI